MKHLIDEPLLMRYFERTLREDEKRSVESWINSSDENRKLAQQVATIYWAGDLLNASKKVNPQQELQLFWEKADRKKRINRWRTFGRAAAILILPILLFSIYMWTGREDMEQVEQLVEVRTQIGVTNSIVLPDSSIVYLNSESVLKYPAHFINNRKVYLKGEAYFVVKKQNGARFTVNTSDGTKVEVLGTEFNVRSGAEEMNATLVKGSVKLVCHGSDNREKEIQMVPGQKVTYQVQTKVVELAQADIDKEIEWKEGKTIFKDCSLMETLEILSERFNVEFIVKKEALKENRFTGSFKNQSLEQILDNFALSSNLKYKYINKRASVTDSSERERIELY